MTGKDHPYDCIIIGAGPGGLQAAIHLCRYNRSVLIINRGGGRTTHAAHIVNYLGIREVSGRELIGTGLQQAEDFGAEVVRDTVNSIEKKQLFTVHTKNSIFKGRFVIVSTGAVDTQPQLKNLGRFFSRSYFTCIDCDGHHTTGKKLLVMGNSNNAVRLAFAMKKMYTDDLALLLQDYTPPQDVIELLKEDGITVYEGIATALLGEIELETVELDDGRKIPCEIIMSTFGWHLNDDFLKELNLKRDQDNFKILTNSNNESSLPGLYVVGALKPGHSQAIIAAGQGAVTAIEINQKLLEL